METGYGLFATPGEHNLNHMGSFNFKDKVVIITGGGSGIGRAIVLGFAENGANVQVLDLDKEAADKTVDEVINRGGMAIAHICNVSKQVEVTSVVDQIFRQFACIDVLINAAGIAHIGKLQDTSGTDMDKVYQVNVKGVYHTMYACIGRMQQIGAGVILNVASVAASVGIPDRFAYSMSKGAVVTMSLSVARDYLKDNIRCNCISPARVHTPFVDGFLTANYPGREEEMFEKLAATQPIGRMAQPKEVAALALYLCSDEASFITGTDYPIDGGFIRLNN